MNEELTKIIDGQLYWHYSLLKSWETNKEARLIDNDNWLKILADIKRNGIKDPFKIDPEGTIYDGNHRFLAITELFKTHVRASDNGHDLEWIPVSIRHPKTEAEKFDIAASGNEQFAQWNKEWLANNLENFQEDLDISLYNFSTDDPFGYEEIVGKKQIEAEEDEPPQVDNETVVSKLGEVYQLGNHRLMCGDATNSEDVLKLTQGQKINLIFTSPPYSIDSGMYKNYGDNLKSEDYIEFNIKTVNTWKAHMQGFLFWNISYNKNSRWEFIEILYRLTKETGLNFLELIVWDKGHGTPITSREALTRQYEDVYVLGDQESIQKDIELYFVGNNARAYFNKKTSKGITNYWKIDTNKTQIDDHLDCFPVKLAAKAINLMTIPQEIVADPFGGSGTTLIAAQQLNRKCFMMELDPKYCDVVRKRYAKLLGRDDWQETTPAINS